MFSAEIAAALNGCFGEMIASLKLALTMKD
jgi:hypothetical protein